MAGMMKWPRSKGMQATIAFVVAFLSAALVVLHIVGESFNHFYFPPYKAYPYPYPTESAARLAICRDCGLMFLGVFAILYVIQRVLIAARHT